MQQRHQSHPRHVAGYLTVPQLARRLGVSPHWLYDRLANGRIQLAKDPATGLYLFPDPPTTGEHLQQLQAGTCTQVCVQAPTADIHPHEQGGAHCYSLRKSALERVEEADPYQTQEEIRISKHFTTRHFPSTETYRLTH